MIPAILSCVYVVYLYVTLNQDPESPTEASDTSAASPAPASGPDSWSALESRLEVANRRLKRLVNQTGKESK